MTKKIFCLLTLLLSLVCLLSSCFHEHSFGEWSVTLAPTCTTAGSEERVCACGEKETKTIPSSGHGAKQWIVDREATCTEDGSRHQICTVCNATIVRQNLSAKGHDEGEWITDQEATCTENGSCHKICTVCNDTLKTGTFEATGHTPGEWITDREATCTEDGSRRLSCTVCNDTLSTETLAATGHTPGEWVTDREATCTEDGNRRQSCTVCNDTLSTETLAATGHDCIITPVRKATEETAALIKSTCNNCDYSHEGEISPISVSAALTDSGITITDSVYYYRGFEVTASGGAGEYQYKFESGSNLLQDYSTINSIEVYGNMFIDAAQITITVKDAADQKTVYLIRGDGTYIDSYPVYED